ncbi:MAG: hypothetical protein C4346_09525 [Chloroflexota bacterium]
MSTADPKAVIRRSFAALDAGDRATLDQLIAPDYRFSAPGTPGPLNCAAFYEFVAGFYRAFPDLRHNIEEQVAVESYVLFDAFGLLRQLGAIPAPAG